MKLDNDIAINTYNLFNELHESEFMDYFIKTRTEILRLLHDNSSGQITTANNFIRDIIVDSTPAFQEALAPLKTILNDSMDMKVVLLNLHPIEYELFIIELRDKKVKDAFDGDAAFVRVEHEIFDDCGKMYNMCSGFIIIDKINHHINEDSDNFILSHEIVHAVMDFMVYNGLLPKSFDYSNESIRDSLEFLADFIPIYNKRYISEDKDSEYLSIDDFISYIQNKFKPEVQEKYKPFIKGLILFFNNRYY